MGSPGRERPDRALLAQLRCAPRASSASPAGSRRFRVTIAAAGASHPRSVRNLANAGSRPLVLRGRTFENQISASPRTKGRPRRRAPLDDPKCPLPFTEAESREVCRKTESDPWRSKGALNPRPHTTWEQLQRYFRLVPLLGRIACSRFAGVGLSSAVTGRRGGDRSFGRRRRR